MRPMPDQRLERIRQMALEQENYGAVGIGTANGIFMVRRKGHVLRIIASDAQDPDSCGWEHVSVSLAHRCPTWEEMCYVKDLFWMPEETVFQIHPPQSSYVNNHPFCLHLWKSADASFPLPPSILVGVASKGVVQDADEARALRNEIEKSLRGKDTP